MKLTQHISVILFVLVSLTACNTINGIGKDIEKAGEVVQKTSKQ